jgi:hypothetical protein
MTTILQFKHQVRRTFGGSLGSHWQNINAVVSAISVFEDGDEIHATEQTRPCAQEQASNSA